MEQNPPQDPASGPEPVSAETSASDAPVTPPALPPEGASPPAAPVPKNERTFAMLCHLSALSALIGVPLGNILGPLIFWLVKRDEMPMVDAHGKESLNFQISTTIYLIVSIVLSFLLIGIPLLIALGIFWLVVVIIASVRANEGVFYRYPLSIRFIS